MTHRPLCFFVHHQGRGHAKRCESIISHIGDRPIIIMSARRDIFGDFDDRVEFVELPDMIGDPSATPALHDQTTPRAFHCVPLGSPRLRQNAGIIANCLTSRNPGLFFVDVSAEWALLSRLCSVPAVKVRMHGDRNDVGHLSAYEACAGLVAPFSETIEQQDYPDWARQKTFYSGGLCTTKSPVPSKEEARSKLGIAEHEKMALVLSGGGGAGAPYAPLTMAARALPDWHWITIGPLHREGHETDFGNLTTRGWVDDPLSFIAAADLVVASAGDNTVHEIARVQRPFLCVPEWRYFNEQVRKAEQLGRVGAAHVLPLWPACNASWQDAVKKAMNCDLSAQAALFSPDAAQNIASYLTDLDESLWSGVEDGSGLPRLAQLSS